MSDLEALYQQYSKTIYYFLLSLSHNEHLAEELTQETMFRAIMNIDSFRGDGKMSVWLCQIAKNLYFEWVKKSKRTVALADEELLPDCGGRELEVDLEDRDAANRILQCLHTLKEPYKEVFSLHALGEVPLSQISQLFGKSESWARVTYYRAKSMIASELKGGET